MDTVSAQLNNYRQSPRKVRLVANFMRGKNAEMALASLDYVDKRASEVLKKLLQSALSNAKNRDIPTDKLFIREIAVNSGETLYRRMPAPHGRAMMIRKKTSRIKLILGEKLGKGKIVDPMEKGSGAEIKDQKSKIKDPEKKPRSKKKAKVSDL